MYLSGFDFCLCLCGVSDNKQICYLVCIWVGCIPPWWIFHRPDVPWVAQTLTTSRQSWQRSPKCQHCSFFFIYWLCWSFRVLNVYENRFNVWKSNLIHMEDFQIAYETFISWGCTAAALIMHRISILSRLSPLRCTPNNILQYCQHTVMALRQGQKTPSRKLSVKGGGIYWPGWQSSTRVHFLSEIQFNVR